MTWTQMLADAIRDADVEVVAEALRQGADVNAVVDRQTLLSGAIQVGDLQVVELLLQAGADPNKRNEDGCTALTWAGDATRTRMLLRAGARTEAEFPNDLAFYSLHNAAGDGDLERCRALLEEGDGAFLLNRFDLLSWTPLFEPAGKGHIEVVRLLIAHGADVNAFESDSGEETAIHMAVEVLRLDIVEVLLKAGADPDLGCCRTARWAAAARSPKFIAPEFIELIERYVPGPRDHRPHDAPWS